MKPTDSEATSSTVRAQGFSLVELLVVIGIIGILTAMLLPALARARRQANTVKCMANMRSVGQILTIYSNENEGWLFPVGKWVQSSSSTAQGHYKTFGYDTTDPRHPNEPRWPEIAFSPAERFPAIMICPADVDPMDNHSYILNLHLAKSPQEIMKFHSTGKWRPKEQIVLMGEKVTSSPDWYMEVSTTNNNTEFFSIVELYRHGLDYGSNYLFSDMHVGAFAPAASLDKATDPWDPFPP